MAKCTNYGENISKLFNSPQTLVSSSIQRRECELVDKGEAWMKGLLNIKYIENV